MIQWQVHPVRIRVQSKNVDSSRTRVGWQLRVCVTSLVPGSSLFGRYQVRHVDDRGDGVVR